MKNPFNPILLTLFIVLNSAPIMAKTMINEASRVVNNIIKQGESTGGTISTFYSEFNTEAANLTQLEAQIEDWKSKGHLCENYNDCPEKWDLIYANSSKIMGNIQNIFNNNRDSMLQSLRSFSKVIYEGKDDISDQRSEELSSLPVKISRIRDMNDTLREERDLLNDECGEDNQSTRCQRKWRHLNRKGQRLNRDLQRIAFTKKIAELRNTMTNKLDGVLDNYTDLEGNAIAMMANYTFIFEQYAEMNGAGGLSNLLNAIKSLDSLEKRLETMDSISQGLQHNLIGMGEALNNRLGSLNGKDISTVSRSTMLNTNTRVLNSNDALLTSLAKEINK